MASDTIKDAVMEIVSVELDDQPFQNQILSCLQLLRENEVERAKFSDSICFEAVDVCSSAGGQERVQFILLNALIIEYQKMVTNGEDLKTPTNEMKNLTKSLCTLNHRSSLQTGNDEMNLRALTFFRNPIEADNQMGLTIVESLLAVARLPHTNETYGQYITALLLAISLYAIAPPPVDEMAQKWNSDYENQQTAFRRDVVDLFGRRLFALGGNPKPATAVHVDLSTSIIASLTEEEFNKSMLGPLKFKLMNAPHDMMETIGAFVNVLTDNGKGNFIQSHLKGGTNLIGSCVKQVVNSEDTKVRDDASFALSAIVKACPEQATNDVVLALIDPLSTGQSLITERILNCLERLANTVSSLKGQLGANSFWETPSNNVITALQNLSTTGQSSALSSWLALAGRDNEVVTTTEISSSTDLLDLSSPDMTKPAESSLDKDLEAKRNAASSIFSSAKPGAHNVNHGASDLDRKIAAKSNVRNSVSNYESQIAAKNKANTRTPQNISDLDDRINRKKRLSDSTKDSFQEVPSQQISAAPNLEVKQTTVDQMCHSTDVESNGYTNIPQSDSPSDSDKKSGTAFSSEGDDDDVAVAVAVDPEDDPFLPSAMEYDPDAKPKLYQNKRFRCAAVISIMVLIAMSVAIAVSVSKNVSETIREDPVKEEEFVTAMPTRTPTRSPTTLLLSLSKEKIIEISHMVSPDIQYNSSLHDNVTKWMARDEIVSDLYFKAEASIYEDPRFIERYTSACLYFSLSQHGLSMGGCRQYDEYALPDENITHCNYTDRNGQTSIRARWLSPFDVCDWGGISCKDLHLNKTVDSIHEIDLHGKTLNGVIPPEIGLLTDLRFLYISDNYIAGTIPRQIGELSQLEILECQSNKLTGPLPIELFSSTNLQQLNFAGNKLEGKIDPKIGDLSYLVGLHLFQNEFSGEIPSEIGLLRSLQEITLSSNSFDGTIPSELGKLQQLVELHLSKNPDLTGRIPSEIGNLNRLRMLILDGCSISDSIPDTIYNLTRLEYFIASNNELDGSISSNISKLKNLKMLWLKQNLFDGIIPSEVGSLSKLEKISFHRNKFRGIVADEICELFTKGTLQEISADCKATKSEDAEVSCWCCTTCCEPGEDGVCHNM